MKRLFFYALALAMVTWGMHAHAAEPVAISDAWARATAPGQEVGAAYMTLTSSTDQTLTKVESPASDYVEIHQMSMKDGKMEMRMMGQLRLPAGEPVKLSPGGFHLMLIDLKKPLKAGDKVEFTLHLKQASGKASLMTVTVPVKKGGD